MRTDSRGRGGWGIDGSWRLIGGRRRLAARLLEQHGMGIAQIAAEVGYDSDAAFNPAFKKCTGITPGAWRQNRLVISAAFRDADRPRRDDVDRPGVLGRSDCNSFHGHSSVPATADDVCRAEHLISRQSQATLTSSGTHLANVG